MYKIILNDWNMLFLFFNNSIVGGGSGFELWMSLLEILEGVNWATRPWQLKYNFFYKIYCYLKYGIIKIPSVFEQYKCQL